MRIGYNKGVIDKFELTKERDCMKKKKLLYAILCALGSGAVVFLQVS